MSTTIDERVVEMKFDNKQFESNVATTMSTLDRLKAALKFDGASKALDELSAASGKFSLGHMEDSVDGVNMRFSALGVAAVEVMRRITNAAIDTARQIERSLGVGLAGIQAGFNKYGEKNTAVATLVGQGYAMEEVNEQLERLNWFTDETSYNFTDMVSNIGKFTASGQKLDESVQAMMGIANWAAMSGQTATTASRAMYQLSQAMGKGVLKYDDWRSIQNASMDTMQFREQAIQAAEAMKILKANADGTYTLIAEGMKGTFTMAELFTSEALSRQQWFTGDVMMKTFEGYSAAVDEIYDYAEAKGITASEAIQALGDSVDEFGLKAFRAAQEARTFRDVTDSVADAVGTAWMKVFETVIGDYEESRTVFTQMANDLYDIFAEPINELNSRLFRGMSTGWKQLMKDSGLSATQLRDILTDSAKEQGIAIDSLIAEYGSFEKSLKGEWLSGSMLQSSLQKLEESLSSLDEEQRKAKGYSEADYVALQDLNEAFANGSVNVDEYAASLFRISGREHLVQALWNLRDALFLIDEEGEHGIGIFAVFKEVWEDIFPPMDGDKIYSIAVAIDNLTSKLIPSEATADRLRRTFGGVVSILDIVKQAAGGILGGIGSLFSVFKGGRGVILDLTSSLGDLITSFANGRLVADLFKSGIERMQNVLHPVKGFFDRIFDSAATAVRNFGGSIRTSLENTIQTIRSWVGSIRDGLVQGVEAFGDDILGPYFNEFYQSIRNVHLSLVDGFSTVVTTAETVFSQLVSMGKTTLPPIFDQIWTIIKNVAAGIAGLVVKSLPTVIDALKTVIVFLLNSLPTIGKVITKILGWVPKLWAGVEAAFSGIAAIVGMVWTGIEKLATGLYNLGLKIWPQVERIFSSLGRLLERSISSFVEFVPTAIQAIMDFGVAFSEYFRDITGMTLPEAFAKIGDAIFGVFESLGDFLVGLSDDSSDLSLLDRIRATLDRIKQDFREVKDTAKTVWDAVTGFLAPVKDQLIGLWEPLKKIMNTLGQGSLDRIKQFLNSVSELNFDGIVESINRVLDLLKSGGIAAVLFGIAKNKKQWGNTLEAITGLINRFTKGMKQSQKNMKANNFLKYAAGIVTMVYSLRWIVDAVEDALVLVKKYGSPKVWEAFGMIAAMIAELGGIMTLIGKFGDGGSSFGTAAGFLAVSKAVDWLTDTAQKIIDIGSSDGGKGWNRLIEAAGFIEQFIGELALALTASNLTTNGAGEGIGNAIEALGLAKAVDMLYDIVEDLFTLDAKYGWKKIIRNAELVGEAIAALAGALLFNNLATVLGGSPWASISAGGGFLALSWAVDILLGVVKKLAAFSLDQIVTATQVVPIFSKFIFEVGLLAAGLSIIATVNPAAPLAAGVAFILFADAIGMMSEAVVAILGVGNVEGAMAIMDALYAFIDSMGGIFVAISALATFIPEGELVGAVAFILFADAVGMLSESVSAVMGAGDIEAATGVMRRMEELIGVLSLCLAGIAELAQWTPGGVLIGAVALEALGDVAQKLASAVGGVAGSLEPAARGIEALSRVANEDNLQKVKNTATALGDMGVGLAMYGYEAAVGIQHLSEAAAAISQIANSGKALQDTLSASVLAELTANLDGLGVSALETAHTISEDSVTIIRSGYMGWYDAGEYLVSGLLNGIDAFAPLVTNRVQRLGSDTLRALKDSLYEQSPSTATEEMGMFLDQGLIRGVDQNADDVNASVTSMGGRALDAMRRVIAQISDYMDGNQEFAPTIRPVLDLSEVESRATRIGAFFSADQAVGIAAHMNNRSAFGGSDDEGTGGGQSRATYSFVQNNYSPKALSRSEIYRQTRNQISAIEGALTTV